MDSRTATSTNREACSLQGDTNARSVLACSKNRWVVVGKRILAKARAHNFTLRRSGDPALQQCTAGSCHSFHIHHVNQVLLLVSTPHRRPRPYMAPVEGKELFAQPQVCFTISSAHAIMSYHRPSRNASKTSEVKGPDMRQMHRTSRAPKELLQKGLSALGLTSLRARNACSNHVHVKGATGRGKKVLKPDVQCRDLAKCVLLAISNQALSWVFLEVYGQSEVGL